jgi:hypothetical protein
MHESHNVFRGVGRDSDYGKPPLLYSILDELNLIRLEIEIQKEIGANEKCIGICNEHVDIKIVRDLAPSGWIVFVNIQPIRAGII